MMEQAGFEQVYQLDGGILKYFEECDWQALPRFVLRLRWSRCSSIPPYSPLATYSASPVKRFCRLKISSDKYLLGQWCPRLLP
ncbi:MAG: hypothetical protein R3C56_25755 [Pirellulaceae bacterium]